MAKRYTRRTVATRAIDVALSVLILIVLALAGVASLLRRREPSDGPAHGPDDSAGGPLGQFRP